MTIERRLSVYQKNDTAEKSNLQFYIHFFHCIFYRQYYNSKYYLSPQGAFLYMHFLRRHLFFNKLDLRINKNQLMEDTVGRKKFLFDVSSVGFIPPLPPVNLRKTLYVIFSAGAECERRGSSTPQSPQGQGSTSLKTERSEGAHCARSSDARTWYEAPSVVTSFQASVRVAKDTTPQASVYRPIVTYDSGTK